MAKSIVLGNGSILVCLDQFGQVKDFYFPYAGLENHVGRNCSHAIGVWVEGEFSWFSSGEWNIVIDNAKATMGAEIIAKNDRLGVTLSFSDAVYNEQNIFLRRITVKSSNRKSRTIKVFFYQQFHLLETTIANTAYVHPSEEAVVHYKGRRVFIVSGMAGEKHFDQYSTGLTDIEGKEGTWRDAEDGELSGNPIEYGSVDSTIGFTLSVSARSPKTISYWITVDETFRKAWNTHAYLKRRTAPYILESARDYWQAWLVKRSFDFHDLSDAVRRLFYLSLLVIRSHADDRGAIIASGDSDILQLGRDTYSYVWPRDAAFAALALDKSGYPHVSERFYDFCANILTDEGYLLHKYNPDRSLGSSWHPWIEDGKPQLPIQEDETALALISLWHHYEFTKDLEFIEGLYNSFIKRAGDFLMNYRGSDKLPKPSYDLWEERYGTTCFTSSAVYGALQAAASFAEVLGKESDTRHYEGAADEIRTAILKTFYKKDGAFFARMKRPDDTFDTTIDASSVYGVFAFGVLDADDSRLEQAFESAREALKSNTAIGGIGRYVGDEYFRTSEDTPGNPWIVTTLWFAEYDIARAQSEAGLKRAVAALEWAVDRAQRSGLLSEQVDPHTGKQLSVSPLVWSHAQFVLTVIRYLERLAELGICEKCYPLKR